MTTNGPRKTVLIIGSLPPPFNGPNGATVDILSELKSSPTLGVCFLDLSDHRGIENIGVLELGNVWLGIKQILVCWVRLLFSSPSVVYLPISQGFWGYARDLGFIVPSLLLHKDLVIHLRGSEFGSFYETLSAPFKALTRWIFRRTIRVIVLGEKLRWVFGGLVSDEKVSVIPNGIDYEQFDVLVGPARSDAAHGARLLFLSSLQERKGVFLLLSAMAHVRERYPHVQLTIAGTWSSKSQRQRALQMLGSLRLESCCQFVGSISGQAKVQTYLGHDIFVFPPVEPEGLPWVILEAMSARLPVITTDQGAITEVVEHGVTGIIAAPNPKELAEHICCLLANPKKCREMGEAGRKRVEAKFSKRQYLSMLSTLLEEVTHAGAFRAKAK